MSEKLKGNNGAISKSKDGSMKLPITKNFYPPHQMKRPAFQFYPKDFLSDRKVIVMSNEQVGGYLKLLCHTWMEDDCTLPNNEDELTALSGLDSGKLQKVLTCFIAHPSLPDRLTHKRLLEERLKQDSRRRKMSDAGKRGNEKRWGKPKNKASGSDQEAIAKHRSPSPSSTPVNPQPPLQGDEGKEVFNMLFNWLKKMDDVKDPKAFTESYFNKYPVHVLKKALSNSTCTSRIAFNDLLKRYQSPPNPQK